MSEIVIPYPELSMRQLTDYSYRDSEVHEVFRHLLKQRGLTPTTHPRTVDLYAGAGSFARLFVDNGWDETNMVCIDKFHPPTPLVPKATWLYWDLDELGEAIVLGEPLPQQVISYQHQFDIAVLRNGGLLPREIKDTLCEYFVRPEGYILTDHRI